MAVIKERISTPHQGIVGKIRSYNELVEFLDQCKPIEYGQACLMRMKELDAFFGYPSKLIDIVLVGGTNGKSSTINFAVKLLCEEGYTVGAFYSSHFLTYNERITIDAQPVGNKNCAELLNEVINAVELKNINATVNEIMLMASLLHFKAQQIDIAFLEVALGGMYDATNICYPKIVAVTRVASDHIDILGKDLDVATRDMMSIAKKDTLFISAEQSKIRLSKMKEWAEEQGAHWVMPIRKLAALPYIFEQLYGRSASLAERIAQIYVENIKDKFSPFLRGNLLATKQGQRGRPTLEAKRQAQLNPLKTLKNFWNEQFSLLHGRFELLDKEKPTILLDNAHNVDALSNVFLGVRLLHYQRSLQGFALIMGLRNRISSADVMKLIRYLFKKISGYVFFVPLPEKGICHDPAELAARAKEFNVEVRTCSSFVDAFEAAKTVVDGRQGLVTICGSPSLVTAYWKMKGMKRLS